MIMKVSTEIGWLRQHKTNVSSQELTFPWTHWFDTNRDDFIASLGSTKDQPSKCDPFNALNDVLFSGPNGPPFSLVVSISHCLKKQSTKSDFYFFVQIRAESLEPIVELSVSKWYDSRFGKFASERHQRMNLIRSPALNFLDANNKALPEVTAVRDWVSHVLLNRCTNIAASATSSPEVKQNADISGVPTTLFFNSHAFQRLLPDAGPDTVRYFGTLFATRL